MISPDVLAKNLHNEVPLFDHYTSPQKRETIETLAEVYSLIITLDQVEKAYLKDCLSSDDYTVTINKLLAQYKTYLSNEDVAKEFGDLTTFKEKYSISASNAITRIERGMPVTVEHAIQSKNAKESSNGSAKYSGKAVAEATGNFITVMDALKLNYRAKDQLHPLMSELLLSINRVTSQDFENRRDLVEWIVKINKMRAAEKLSEDEASELLFSVDTAYKSFYTLLE
ncbi:LAQU0S16e02058g1_1 [Lachancea quebecensis]|uniref:Vacuolar protein sorting-associated protein 28 n=1 Tax=Lachancea quebecensis TaxID=1654605 RepID=A0A0P1KWP6_9SACH|nr:LAQU0S16e02058g1_1 [Lachancea quebecensis]